MKKLVFLLLILPLATSARFSLSLSAGITPAGTNPDNYNYIPTYGPYAGVVVGKNASTHYFPWAASIKGSWSTHRLIFGAGVAGGRYQEKTHLVNADYFHIDPHDANLVMTGTYVIPHAFLNVKHKLGSRLYLYEGVMAGYRLKTNFNKDHGLLIASGGYTPYQSAISLSGNKTGIALGAQIGALYHISDHVSLDLEAGVRRIDSRARPLAYYTGSDIRYRIWDYPVTIGVKFRLGSSKKEVAEH